jgi:hypothetical protein
MACPTDLSDIAHRAFYLIPAGSLISARSRPISQIDDLVVFTGWDWQHRQSSGWRSPSRFYPVLVLLKIGIGS